jgi:hypothetical protein
MRAGPDRPARWRENPARSRCCASTPRRTPLWRRRVPERCGDRATCDRIKLIFGLSPRIHRYQKANMDLQRQRLSRHFRQVFQSDGQTPSGSSNASQSGLHASKCQGGAKPRHARRIAGTAWSPCRDLACQSGIPAPGLGGHFLVSHFPAHQLMDCIIHGGFLRR